MKTKLILICLLCICWIDIYSQIKSPKVIQPSVVTKSKYIKTVFRPVTTAKYIWNWNSITNKYQKVSNNNSTSNSKIIFGGKEWAISGKSVISTENQKKDNYTKLNLNNTNTVFIKESFNDYQHFDYNPKQISSNHTPFKFTKEDGDNVTASSVNIVKLDLKDGAKTSYLNKLRLGTININNSSDLGIEKHAYIIVTDSLYISSNSVITAKDTSKRVFIKIVANKIITEGVINLKLGNHSDFDIISPNYIQFKTTSGTNTQLLKSIPIAIGANATNIFHSHCTNEELKLLSNLYLIQMKKILNYLPSEQDEWVKDKLIANFRNIRFNKINTDKLEDSKASEFRDLCKEFDESYIRHTIKSKRRIANTDIIIDDTDGQGIKYYTTPKIAKLLPVFKDSIQLLGIIKYNEKGASKPMLILNVELGIADSELANVNKELAKKGISIEKTIPSRLLQIDKQIVSIGTHICTIYPLSNNIIRLEIEIDENSHSVMDIFPMQGSNEFKIEYAIANEPIKYSNKITLNISNEIQRTIKYDNLLDNFNVFPNTNWNGTIQLSCGLQNLGEDQEGILNYVQVMVEIQFSNKTMNLGTFMLAGANTYANSINIPFFKENDNYKVRIGGGYAQYQNGRRDLISQYESDTSNEIIVLTDQLFNPNQN